MKKTLKIIMIIVLAVAAVASAYACKKKSVEISFETNGGSAIAAVKVEKETEYVLPTGTVREGYAFAGWYDNAELSGSAVEKITVKGKAKYYAKWEQLYAVSLDAAGGSGIPSVVYLKAGANVRDELAGYVPQKNGLVFGAWFEGDRELGANTRMTEKGLS